VLLSVATLLVYTPHTLSVTCPVAAAGARQPERRDSFGDPGAPPTTKPHPRARKW
jgi:hypothetical protein